MKDKKPVKVLAVDDQAGSRKLIERYFEISEKPMCVETVSSAEEAIESLEKNSYDAIIADHRLPGKTGLELASETNESTYFILHSGLRERETERKARSGNVDCYLTKDSGREYFQKIIDKIHRHTRPVTHSEELEQR